MITMLIDPGNMTTAQRKCMKGLKDVILQSAAEELTFPEILAIVAHLTGAMMSSQDKRDLTVLEAMDIVLLNQSKGRHTMDDFLSNAIGSNPILSP